MATASRNALVSFHARIRSNLKCGHISSCKGAHHTACGSFSSNTGADIYTRAYLPLTMRPHVPGMKGSHLLRRNGLKSQSSGASSLYTAAPFNKVMQETWKTKIAHCRIECLSKETHERLHNELDCRRINPSELNASASDS